MEPSAGDTYNTAVGFSAGGAVTTGTKNVVVGGLALDAANTGAENTAIGHQALTADTKGNRNVAVGAGTLGTQNFTTATSVYNVAVGYNSGNLITTGTSNY